MAKRASATGRLEYVGKISTWILLSSHWRKKLREMLHPGMTYAQSTRRSLSANMEYIRNQDKKDPILLRALFFIVLVFVNVVLWVLGIVGLGLAGVLGAGFAQSSIFEAVVGFFDARGLVPFFYELPVVAWYVMVAIAILMDVIHICKVIYVKSFSIKFYQKKIIISGGVFRRESCSIMFVGITRVDDDRKFVGRIFNFGNLYIDILGKGEFPRLPYISRFRRMKRFLDTRYVETSRVNAGFLG